MTRSVDDFDLDPELELWEPMKGEERNAYDAFALYRDQPYTDEIATGERGRSQRVVADHLGRPRVTVAKWSRRWAWVERARAYDLHIEREKRTAAVAEIGKMAERHAKITGQAITALSVPAQALLKRLLEDPDAVDRLSRLPLEGRGGLVDLVAVAGRVLPGLLVAERVARGLPSETVAVGGTVAGQAMLTIEELQEVGRILNDSGVLGGAPVSGNGSAGVPTEDDPLDTG